MTDLPGDTNQAEHTHISTALEVETLDVTLFRSKTVWLPNRARGVFGGQVISQAIVSATKCVDKSYGLHVSALFIYRSSVQTCADQTYFC
jgi:acyl-CoA thioesterase